MKNRKIMLNAEIMDEDFYNSPVKKSVFLHFLFAANYEDSVYNGVLVPRGSLIVNGSKLRLELGLKDVQFKYAIRELKGSSHIATQKLTRGMIVTVCDYDFWVCKTKERKQSENNTESTAINIHKSVSKDTDSMCEIVEDVPKQRAKYRQDVLDVFDVYPDRCPIKGVSLFKCEGNKKEIRKLLKTHTKESLIGTIKAYVDDCENCGRWMKTFKNFLENLPEPQKTIIFEPEFKLSDYEIPQDHLFNYPKEKLTSMAKAGNYKKK